MDLKWLVFLIGPLDSIGMWFNEDQRSHHNDMCLKDIGLRLQILITYHTITNKQNWQNLCIQTRNQQTCTSNTHNKIKGGPISNPVFADFHRRFANARLH